ncbi:hypothetical protein TBLA_0D01300 [Henningerozyma blattae CBS 6284]|uniref:MutL C-terminal dimerisation domain-containing protein n=1 Tax=Henningerozyma blattae (strain ATCC 34711 / CBS 6284 / DSM 70876 / NBRC 10599 / NRRL Y-10934 / UCD 77-7) TaxID=1071380 RepID=I2H2N6_HENB6|nr:hypothetical protein TBLA_0D01300 [Tetrapisispora blattae CBS 6284]CCH60638.1 hypothetical protein TBLA_0D01300 [Tetrapisispora blattae CBS 6284]
MAASIHQLNLNVTKLLKSQVLVTDIINSIREVIQNSVDACATHIEVIVDYEKLWFVVVDNGDGISPVDLGYVSNLNATSKLNNSFNPDDKIKTYGFKGESLFGISKVSRLNVVSKVKDYNSTWLRERDCPPKIMDSIPTNLKSKYNFVHFEKGKSGTIVIVEELFFNLPVRKQMEENVPDFKKIEALRLNIFQILVYHPAIQFDIYTSTNGIQTPLLSVGGLTKSNLSDHLLLIESFTNVFGSIMENKKFKKVNLRLKDISIQGVISKASVTSKQYQFIYINGRRLISNDIFRKINTAFYSCNFGSEDNVNAQIRNNMKYSSRYPILILKVSCSLSFFDLLQNNSKDISEPSNYSILGPLLLKAISSFLKHQGYSETAISSKSTLQRPPNFNMLNVNTISNFNPRGCTRPAIINPASTYSLAKIIPKEIHGMYKASGSLSMLTRPRLSNVSLPRNNCFITKKKYDMPTKSNLLVPKISMENLNCLQNITITENSLKQIHFINQLDRKFLLVKCHNLSKKGYLDLLVIDQHACDERIKLEALLGEFMHTVLNKSIPVTPINDIYLQIEICDKEAFQFYEGEFKLWGIGYSVVDTYEGIHKKNNVYYLKLSTISTIVREKFKTNWEKLKVNLLQHIDSLRHLKKLSIKSVVGSKTKDYNWWEYTNYIPVFYLELFNSKACRSAIMFGNELSREDCNHLINELSKCHNPFQCAHGRPSIKPLLQWNNTNTELPDLSNENYCNFNNLDYEY